MKQLNSLAGQDVKDALIDGVVSMCHTMCDSVARPISPLLKVRYASDGGLCVAGTIDLVSGPERASAAICFPMETYLKVMRRILDAPELEMGPDIADGAAEMMNVIFGHAKTRLNRAGHDLQLALPRVVIGQVFRLHGIDDGSSHLMQFHAEFGVFHMSVSDPQPKEAPHV